MRSAAAEAAREALEGVDPIRAVATLAVCYAMLKLVHLVVTAPAIPTSLWVPLEPGETSSQQQQYDRLLCCVRGRQGSIPVLIAPAS